uniref:Uncharacterized protein n=1 Tax=Arion vulgaris TaxID=1028688 RepID=A0A0B7AX62_9EUPU
MEIVQKKRLCKRNKKETSYKIHKVLSVQKLWHNTCKETNITSDGMHFSCGNIWMRIMDSSIKEQN